MGLRAVPEPCPAQGKSLVMAEVTPAVPGGDAPQAVVGQTQPRLTRSTEPLSSPSQGPRGSLHRNGCPSPADRPCRVWGGSWSLPWLLLFSPSTSRDNLQWMGLRVRVWRAQG